MIRFSTISCSTDRYVIVAVSGFPSALLTALNLYVLSGRSKMTAAIDSSGDELANVSGMLVLEINSGEDGTLPAAQLAGVIVVGGVIWKLDGRTIS
jgi:hypothetical protein